MEPYYNLMENQEVDRLLTHLALQQSLVPRSIRITAPEPGQIPGYLETQEDEEQQEESEPQPQTVTIGKVTMVLWGQRENFMGMMDDMAQNYPSLQLEKFTAVDQEYLDGSGTAAMGCEITCEINVLMCVR